MEAGDKEVASDVAEAGSAAKRLDAKDWMAVALALVASGLLSGWLIGLSETPVVGVALPLLFGLVAGAGGFRFAANDLGGAGITVLRGSALAIAVFSLSVAGGVHEGINARLRGEAASRQLATLPITVGDAARLRHEDLLDLAATEKKMLLVGLSPEVVRAFGERYVADRGSPSRAKATGAGPQMADIEELERALGAASKALGDAKKPGPAPQMVLSRYLGKMPGFIEQLQTFKGLAGSGRSIPRRGYGEFLESVRDSNHALIDQREGNQKGRVLTPAPLLDFGSLYALEAVLDAQIQRFGESAEPGNDTAGAASDILDSAIRLSQGAASTAAREGRYAVKH